MIHEGMGNLTTLSCNLLSLFAAPKFCSQEKYSPRKYLYMKKMGGVSYSSKNRGYQLVEAVFLSLLRAPEHLPLLFPTPILPIVNHTFISTDSFIILTFRKHRLLAYYILMTSNAMMNITPLSFTEGFTSPGKFSKRTGRGHLNAFSSNPKAQMQATSLPGEQVIGKDIRTRTVTVQKESYSIPIGKSHRDEAVLGARMERLE